LKSNLKTFAIHYKPRNAWIIYNTTCTEVYGTETTTKVGKYLLYLRYRKSGNVHCIYSTCLETIFRSTMNKLTTYKETHFEMSVECKPENVDFIHKKIGIIYFA
jgi:hypothetical protein